MHLQIKPSTEFEGRLRSVLFKRLVSPVCVCRNGKPIAEFHPDNTLIGVTMVFGKKDGRYIPGRYTIRGWCEGLVELSDEPDLFDSDVHFPAFTGEDYVR